MDKNFVDFCFFDRNILFIKFSVPMHTSTHYSILNPSNFSVEFTQNKRIFITLDKLIINIQTFGDDFVSFYINETFTKELYENHSSIFLYVGFISPTKTYFVMTKSNLVNKIHLPTAIIDYANATKLKNVSIISYEDFNLSLALEATNEILRYAASDFSFTLCSKVIYSATYIPYAKSKNIMYITLKNIDSFDLFTDFITVKYLNKSIPYTIDLNYNNLLEFRSFTSKSFISKKGIISYTSNIFKTIIKITFSEYIKKIKDNVFILPSINTDKSKIELNIENIGILNIFGENLILPPNLKFSTAQIFSTLDVLNIIIDCSTFNFFFQNIINISYCDFTSFESILSINNIQPYKNFSAFLKIEPLNIITSIPLDNGVNWTMLGAIITTDTQILVDKTSNIFIYGSPDLETTFTKTLYLYNLDDGAYDDINITLINIKAQNFFVKLSANFTLNIENCNITNLEIL